MRIYGFKEMVLEPEQDLGGGLRRAGLSRIVVFVMELVTYKNYSFWNNYANSMKLCAKGSKHQAQTDIAIKGFTNALELVGSTGAAVFVVYSTLDPATVADDNAVKMINIQMCMTVTTSSTIRDFPAVTHMGIFRSPLLSCDLTQLDAGLGEFRQLLSKQPDFYRGKPAQGISLVLHGFAARGLTTFLQGFRPTLMITAPVEHMGGLLSQVGRIFAEDISPKVDDRTIAVPSRSSSSVVKSITAPPRITPRSPSTFNPGPKSKGSSPPNTLNLSLTKPTVSSQTSPSPPPDQTSIANNNNAPASAISHKDEVAASSSSPTPTRTEGTEPKREVVSIDEVKGAGRLIYRLNRSPITPSIEIRYNGKTYRWTNIECGWLFQLAFNPSHKYAATFTDFGQLCDSQQDLTMTPLPQFAKIVDVDPPKPIPAEKKL